MLRVEGEGGITFNINKDVQIRLTSIFSMRLDFAKLMIPLVPPSFTVGLIGQLLSIVSMIPPRPPRSALSPLSPLTLLIGNTAQWPNGWLNPIKLCIDQRLPGHVMLFLINFSSSHPIFDKTLFITSDQFLEINFSPSKLEVSLYSWLALFWSPITQLEICWFYSQYLPGRTETRRNSDN